LRRLLPAGLISVALMTGCNGHNDNAQNAGPEESPSDSSLAVSSDGGEIVNEAAARLADSSIRFHDGRLSAALDDMPLLQVVTEVSRQTGIEIQFIGEHPAFPKYTPLRHRGVPLIEVSTEICVIFVVGVRALRMLFH